MTVSYSFLKDFGQEYDTLVFPVYEGPEPGLAASRFSESRGGFLPSVLSRNPSFKGKIGQSFILPLTEEEGPARLILLGLGEKAKLDPHVCEKAGGALAQALKSCGAVCAAFQADDETKDENPLICGVHVALGVKLRHYSFDKYKSRNEEDEPPKLENLDVIVNHVDDAQAMFNRLNAAVDGTLFARDLISEPANHLQPVAYAERLREKLEPLGVEVSVFDENALAHYNMGAFLAVGQGSAAPPRMVVMEWKGTEDASDAPPLALVGKGITFDTGGISIKPAAEMDLMKMDMGGSAAVAGAMMALALRGSKAHVVGVVGLAENMLSSNAYRPSDVVTSMSGKTIEVLNTDAEGRLVLGDCLTYAQKHHNPETIIDLATLTGAMMIALGFEYAGAFVNHDELWQKLETASKTSGEKLWRMPLDEVWRKEMESKVADLKNLGTSGRYAGACTAAGFLEHFIEDGVRWAHIDIAGTAWIKADKPLTPKGGSGFGVRVLDRFIEENYG